MVNIALLKIIFPVFDPSPLVVCTVYHLQFFYIYGENKERYERVNAEKDKPFIIK